MIPFFVRAWAGWPSDTAPTDKKILPTILRRRTTAIGRKALETAGALPTLDTARFVFSSRHGEFSRTLAILRSIAANEPLSPTEFSMSVHHALASLLSISSSNHAGHTALAGGAESLCFAMLEAVGCLTEAPWQPVVLIHCDEPLPDEYQRFSEDAAPAVLALLLEARGEDMFSISMTENRSEPPSPTSAAIMVQRFLEGTDATLNYYDRTRHWKWIRHGLG